jgi:FKBP-type peptidyl-prolyl cis-trans isomerases 2
MPVEKGDFIRLHYTGEIEGNIFDTTDEGTARSAGIFNETAAYGPVVIHVGSGHVVAGLDEALEGKEPGEKFEVDVAPEKAFGEHNETLVESVPVSKFKENPEIGTRVQLEGREGVVVNKIGRRVLVDFNHPLAGKTAHYTVTILEKVEVVEEQVRGLIKLYSQRDMDATFVDGVLSITLPAGIQYDRRWLLWRGRVISDIFATIPSVQEITLLENFKRPEKMEKTGSPEESSPQE